MPTYDVYRFDKVRVGTVTCGPREQKETLIREHFLLEKFRDVALHGDYANGNYISYDPETEPATPLLLLEKISD